MDNNWTLVVNVGSTSVKTALFTGDLVLKAALNASQNSTEWAIDGQGLDGCAVTASQPLTSPITTLVAGLLYNWRCLLQSAGIKLTAIGHRVVHGGIDFQTLTLITPRFLDCLGKLDAYAPLHNPANRLGISLAGDIFPGIPQFALFDTAFHRSIPERASRYAIPQQLCATVAFHRFGFHGISCQHSLTRAASLLGCDEQALNLIILHLGGGASITAVSAGKSIDTSMGFSPLEGLIMASRSGDLDPAIILSLLQQGWSVQQLDNLLNHQSGLQGLCGETDMRTIISQASAGEDKAKLAIDMFCYRIKKYIGAYYAVLGKPHALVFTGGIGEHAPLIRANIIEGLEALGFCLDAAANQSCQNNSDISQPTGDIRILVIHAEEEHEIARQINNFQSATLT